ncbi:M48 family metallopeptidase [Croceimicrobium sp.]|uniref:M48 family metallopeptidase n=1 Tax=Croceimicrobium sp. TaxID=2828340 RepID=UPI003BAC639A
MRKLVLTALIIAIGACKTVPLTGRKQVALIPGAQMNAMAVDQYQQVLSQSKVIKGTAQAQMVERVGQKIASAVERYLRQKGHADMVKDFKWEFALIDENVANAWCMPGGKVAFYTGIMGICQDEAGIAVVMGHEIAHAVASHGSERMSQGLIQQMGGVALQVAINDQPEKTKSLYMTAYGIGSQYGAMLPFSRLHESEADKMGLVFMGMAGYDPREAPKFWERMAAQSGGNQPPEFMSTHPSHSTRIKDLNANMGEAMKYYLQTQQGQ